MADTGTNVDLAPVKEVTDAEAARFKLDPHLIKLMWDEPFFSKVLRPITKVKTSAIPTAGVLAKEGDIKMWWNPKFVGGLTSKQVKGLLKHECFHLVFEHTTTHRKDPHIIWNYATDLAINSLIPRDELPDGGLVPGEAFRELTEEDKAKMGAEAVGRYERVSAKIASFQPRLSAYQYFSLLQEVAEDIEQGKGGKGEPGEPGEPGGEGEGEGVPGLPGPMDDHDGWDEMSAEDRELLKGKIRQSVEDAVKECDKKGAWGSVGADTRQVLRELVTNEVPWQSVLKQFCGMTRRANRSSNVRRLHRKYPGIHPGTQKGYTSSIAVYIDQSGSMSQGELELLFGELKQLAKRTEFTCFHFDTEIDLKSETTWRAGKTPKLLRTQCGGTDFRPVIEHANKNAKRFDGFLILTDGGAADPGPSKLKRGYVITPGNRLAFEASKRDFVINMKQPKKMAA
jgi:predicted metal-dependent peptidase